MPLPAPQPGAALTFGSLFSGAGMFDLALERAGMRCLWQCEIDKQARSVLRRHLPDTPVFKDIREIDTDQLIRDGLRPDVIVGGWPCTDLSVAGRREGLSGERSGLWFEMLRILDGLKAEWVVGENVPGLLSSWNPVEPPPSAVEGSEWTVEETSDLETVLVGLAGIGYRVCWRVLDGRYFNVAQRRERVFFVGHLGGGRAAEVLFEPEGVRRHSQAGRAQREDAAGTLGGGSESRGWSDLDRMTFIPSTACALKGASGGNGGDPVNNQLVTAPLADSGDNPFEGEAALVDGYKLVQIVLTIAHHPDPDPRNCADENLQALCQRCHNRLDMPMRKKNAKATLWRKRGGPTLAMEI